jgi:hypothetical protein
MCNTHTEKYISYILCINTYIRFNPRYLTMDAISLIGTILPAVIALVFTGISVADLKEQFMEKAKTTLTPLWCFIAGLCWIVFGIVSLYGTTTEYLIPLTFIYFGIGFLFFPIIFFASIIQNITLTGRQRERDETEVIY